MTRESHVALRRMVFPHSSSPLLMSLMLLLLMQLPPRALAAVNRDMCPCTRAEFSSDTVVLEENLTDTTTRRRELNCCARRLLAAHDPHYHSNDSFIIVWSFKGKEYKDEEQWPKEVSTFKRGYCGLETLESKSLQFYDEGVYSCEVTSSSGASVTKNFSLCLKMNEDLGNPPRNPSISGNDLALLRDEVVFSCSAYVGERRCARKEDYRLVWTKESPNGSWTEASTLAHADITASLTENDVMKSQLTIRSVETKHYGRYRCTVTNPSGSLTLNVTLSKGVPLKDRLKGQYLAAVVTLVGAAMFLAAAVLCCHRCQVAFSLHFRQKKTLSSEDHQYDVFLVHGESASLWVWSFLLPALEDSFGYTCFMPQRDMCGGSMILEEVAEMVHYCRCVVIVITPCLLESPWAAWAIHNAMKAALQARTRLLALLLQDMKPRKGVPDTSGIIGVLKHIRKIPVPRSSRWENVKPKKGSHPHSPPEEDTKVLEGNNCSKALCVDTTQCRSRSKSPKKQKLANMISGGNMDSKHTARDKKERSPVMFMEKEDSADPCSPCSETPFIWPSSADAQKHKAILVESKKKPSLSTFLSVLCAGDQQEVFWHSFLGWLGPSGATTPQQDASPTSSSA